MVSPPSALDDSDEPAQPGSGSEAIPDHADADDPKYRTWPYVERRRQRDRRARPTRWWDALQGAKRRKYGRRVSEGESENIFVDLYEKRDGALILGIFLLNILDAALTLVHISQGGEEVNPLMAHLLDLGTYTFLYEKCAVVGICLITLAIHKTFKLARRSSVFLLCVYSTLAVYHVFLRLVS